jgi:hypothetical protein
MQVFVGAVLTAVSILERKGRRAVGELPDFGRGVGQIVGMHELHERRSHEFLSGISQHTLERGVDSLEVAVHPGYTTHVHCVIEELL